jgi:tetratricopeptide (TPR) repeat protein
MKRFYGLTLFFIFTLTTLAQNSAVTNAALYLQQGDIAKAKIEIDKAAANDKTMSQSKTWYYRGMIYKGIFESKKPEVKSLYDAPLKEAGKSFLKAIDLDPSGGEFASKSRTELTIVYSLLVNKGVELYENADHFNALSYFSQAQQVNPFDTTAYIYALYSAEEMDSHELVKEYCTQLIKLKSKNPYPYYRLIDIEFNQEKHPDKAFQYSDKAVELFPNNADLLLQRADMMVRMNRGKEAADIVEKIKAKYPNNIDYIIQLAVIYDKTKQTDKAKLNYKEALSKDSLNFIANFNMAILGIQDAKKQEKKILSSDSLAKANNKTGKPWVPEVGKDVERQKLSYIISETQVYYNRAAKHVKDVSERKRLEMILAEMNRLRSSYLK